jgi:tetratricopeptide (TPR) repeat protein
MHCSIHTLYTFALDLHDIPLALLVKSLGQQPSNSLSPLSSPSSSDNNSFEPYVKIVTRQELPKSSTDQKLNESYTTLRSVQTSNNQPLRQSRITPEQMSLQQKMRVLLQQIEEYCGETYPELGITINSTQTPPVTYPADPLLPNDFRGITMPPQIAWAIAERRYEDARRMVDSSLYTTQSFSLYCLRGHLHKAMDSLEASIADYSRALSLQESGEIYRQRGTQYFTANKREEAYQDFQNAVRLEPKDAQAVFMRGAAAYNLKRFEEACDDWSLAAQMGHPLADSMMEVKCLGYVPKYARTAIAEKKQQSKNFLLLLERVRQGVQALPFGKESDALPNTYQPLDSLSYRRISGTCNMTAVLNGGGSISCIIHIRYYPS